RKAKTGAAVRLTVDLKAYQLGALGDFTPQGLRVRIVAPGTAAEVIGLQPGDVIAAIDNQAIRTQADFKTALRASGGSVVLLVRKAPLGILIRLPADL